MKITQKGNLAGRVRDPSEDKSKNIKVIQEIIKEVIILNNKLQHIMVYNFHSNERSAKVKNSLLTWMENNLNE